MSKLLNEFEKIKNYSSWKDFIEIIEKEKEGGKDLMEWIDDQIGDSFTPEVENVFNFLKTDFQKIKVVILGQDPYFQKGVATGRAFEVGNINCWCDPIPQTSLINIVKSIYYFVKKKKILTISKIREEIKKRKFDINCSIKGWFDDLENQGVLFLNTAFTCKIDEPNSHDFWKPFTKHLINHIIKKKPESIWLIWGDEARNLITEIDSECKISNKYDKACHPRLYAFIDSQENGIEETSKKINWYGTDYLNNKLKVTSTDKS